MAVNCVNKFNDPNTNIRFMQSDVMYDGSIVDQFSGAFFRFEMIENETIFFTLRLQPNTVQPINVQFTLYRKTGETTYTNLGTSQSDEFYNSFQYSATPGEYYVCITTDWSINYELTAEFTDYPYVIIADCDAYAGEYMPPFDFARPQSICDSQVFYQIIEGKLPKGLEFSADGVIYGIPEEQDCESPDDEKPSFLWWEESEGGERTSTGMKYRIVVRAALVDAPETYDDREFYVCVHNNWDNDRDHFLGLKDQWETPVYVLPEDAPRISLEPVVEEKPLELVSPCPPVQQPEPKQATLEEIQQLAKMVVINEEFKGLVQINKDGLCEVCEQPEGANEFSLKTIPIEHCEPCPEPTVIQGLQPLPKSLCPSEVEQIETDSGPQYVPGIPEICYPSLLRDMMTTKVCHGRPSCPPVQAIYPKIKQEKFKLKDLCGDD